MAFLKFLFYAVLYLLIKIGDFLLEILSFIEYFISIPQKVVLSAVLKIKSFLPNFKRKKNKSRSKQNTISLNSRFDFSPLKYVNKFSFYVRKSGGYILFALIYLFKELFRFLTFLATVLIYPFKLPLVVVNSIFRRKKHRGRPKTAKIRTSFLYKVKYTFIGVVISFIFFFLPATFLIFIADLPKLSNLSVNYIPKTTKIMDRNGNLLFEVYGNQNRTIVSLESIPKSLKEATIAIEDKDFYKHSGFDVRGIARAIYVDITKKDLQGGSTITQQLIKSALLTPETTLTRKARELVLAFWAEKEYTKDEILELYFNYVPYGGTAWGIEAASQIYFGKNVSELSLAESAYLAGLPQAPSQYSPFSGNGSLGKKRQKDVLASMVSEGYITQKDAEKAYQEKLSFKSPQVPIQAPHFVMYVKDLLVREYGLQAVERGGLQVTTTLDMDVQKLAEGVVSEQVESNGYLGIGNGASLVTNPENGDILAMVGSKDYFDLEHDGNVNITTSLRQPGSTIKLLTYTLALSKGMTEASILDDLPLTVKSPGAPTYTPVNYDGKFHGRVPLRIALANSFNIPAVRLVQKLGVDNLVSFAKEMGVTSWGTPERYGLSITLGAAEVSMIDLATVYGTVANGGERVNLNPIIKITDSEGTILKQKEVEGQRVVSEEVAYIVSDILSDNKARSIEFGTNSPLSIPDRKISVKTGTTDNKRDNWTVGYTPNLLVVTWVGNNDNTPLSQALASGITGAAPMWNKIITGVLNNYEYKEMAVPENIVSRQCFGFTVYFVRGTEVDRCRVFIPSPTFQQQ